MEKIDCKEMTTDEANALTFHLPRCCDHHADVFMWGWCNDCQNYGDDCECIADEVV